GCVPLWTAQGSGASGRRILGTVVIGGMSAASLIAIFLIPVTFAVVEGLSSRLSRHPQQQPEAGDAKGGQLA
ncbi:MAG: efflux RND transporter permease subunit, partial [Acidobacteriia bacterium]|nr:efflux RND transporter permease subunit [Terriglobia bacterium]